MTRSVKYLDEPFRIHISVYVSGALVVLYFLVLLIYIVYVNLYASKGLEFNYGLSFILITLYVCSLVVQCLLEVDHWDGNFVCLVYIYMYIEACLIVY